MIYLNLTSNFNSPNSSIVKTYALDATRQNMVGAITLVQSLKAKVQRETHINSEPKKCSPLQPIDVFRRFISNILTCCKELIAAIFSHRSSRDQVNALPVIIGHCQLATVSNNAQNAGVIMHPHATCHIGVKVFDFEIIGLPACKH
jgi:hypothetical protein